MQNVFMTMLMGLVFLTCGAANAENAVEYIETGKHSSCMQPLNTEDPCTVTNDESWYLDVRKAEWAFKNISQFLPVSIISRGDQPIKHLPRAKSDLLEKVFEDEKGDKRKLRDILSRSAADGFIALKQGKIISEAYFDDFRPDSRHIVFSVTKTLVGLTAGVLINEGKIDPDAQVTKYLPELTDSGFKGATIRNLLNMTAGADWNKVRSDPKSLVNINAMAGGFLKVPDDFPFDSTLSFLSSLGPVRNHGEKHVYNSSNTEALAWVISRVTGRPWQNAFSERIWSQLGAERDATIVVNGTGHGFGTAGFSASLRDLARVGLLMEQDGQLNRRQIVPANWIKETLTEDSVVKAAWQASTEKKRKPHVRYYKNQTRVIDADKGEFIATGFMGQIIYVNQQKDFVGVVLSVQPDRRKIGHLIPLIRAVANHEG